MSKEFENSILIDLNSKKDGRGQTITEDMIIEKNFKKGDKLIKTASTIIVEANITIKQALESEIIKEFKWDQWQDMLAKYDGDKTIAMSTEKIFILQTGNVVYPASESFLKENYKII